MSAGTGLWVADENGKVIQIQTLYADSVREITHEEFVTPRSLCIVPETGDCWVADTKSLFRISGECERIATQFVHPMAIAADCIDRHLWLADSSRIVNLSYEGEYQFAIENDFKFVYAIAVDPGTSDLWAADGIGNTSLLKFDRVGNELFRVSGFRTPRTLAVSAHDHCCILRIPKMDGSCAFRLRVTC